MSGGALFFKPTHSPAGLSLDSYTNLEHIVFPYGSAEAKFIDFVPVY